MQEAALLEIKDVERNGRRDAQQARRYVIDIDEYVNNATKKPSKKC